MKQRSQQPQSMLKQQKNGTLRLELGNLQRTIRRKKWHVITKFFVQIRRKKDAQP